VAAAHGEVADAALSPADCLVDLASRLTLRLYQEIGFEVDSESLPVRQERHDLRQVVREVSMQTNDVAGDGTTTSIVLANGMIQQGVALIGFTYLQIRILRKVEFRRANTN
ncbi:MAG: hypothetical protein HGA94_04135, partial [Candidatus Aminicenantes bacterium]|nr:hypothetical protein [Candidatus Aminicenantes bacterium]